MTLLVALLSFAIGVVAGLRSLTAPAVVAWTASFGWLRLDATPVAFLGTPVARYLLAALMLGELVGDKLPSTPSRTRPGPLVARIVTGGLAGSAIGVGTGGSALIGALLGACGGAVGAFGGYRARTGLVRRLRVPDITVALAEDVVAVGGALLIVAAAS